MFRKLVVTPRLTRQACLANLPASENLPVRDMSRACEIRVRHNYYRNLLNNNNFDFFRIYFNIFGINYEFEILRTFRTKFAFFDINLQACLLKALDDFMYVYGMFEFIF